MSDLRDSAIWAVRELEFGLGGKDPHFGLSATEASRAVDAVLALVTGAIEKERVEWGLDLSENGRFHDRAASFCADVLALVVSQPSAKAVL